MTKIDWRARKPTGKCPKCEINCWAETNGEPAIWPCGLGNCPYPHRPQTSFEHSQTGSSLLLTIYKG